jgi:hypothetical protein
MGIGDNAGGAEMSMGMANMGGGGGQMNDAQIKKLFGTFKVDIKPMINDIAERIAETKTVTLKR